MSQLVRTSAGPSLMIFALSGSGSPTSADEGKRTRGGIVCPLDRGEAGRSRAGNSLIT